MKKMILPLALTYFLLSTSLFSQGWIPVGQDVLPDNYYTWALSAIDENTVFAICENDDYSVQKLVRTIDGGATWNVVELSIKPGYPQDIHAISADTIWIVYREASGTTKLYLSTDAGQTLEEKFSYQGNFVIGPALLFGDKESGYMIDPSLIKGSYTNDGGVSWESQAIFPTYASGETWGMANPTNWMDAKGDTIWWGTSKFIHRSTDNGATWQSFDNDFSDGVETKCISFSQSGLGLAASNTNFDVLSVTHISASTDGGATWAELPIVNLPLEGITDVPGLNDAFVGVGGIFKDFVPGITHQYVSAYTLDGGLNWTVIDSFPLNAVEFVSPDAGWAGKILSHEYEGNPVLYKWSGPLTGNRLFVNDDAAGLNNGTSWADAFTDLQSALAIAEEGNEIWVAEGTYLPGSDPTATFLMDKNISLFGGFAGTETALAERGDPADHPTILSGDLNGDDVVDDFVTNRGDNVMTVVTMTAAVTNETVMDGFTISNGQADGTGSGLQRSGGGLYCTGSPIVRQCRFEQNVAFEQGGGAWVQNSFSQIIVIENCQFDKNTANAGGGVQINSSMFNMEGCNFSNNETRTGNSEDDGGGMWVVNSHGDLSNTAFTNNNANDFGGGLGVYMAPGFNGGTINMRGCLFENNSSDRLDGGASFSCRGNNSFFTISNCEFIGNTGVNDGGGLALFSDATTTAVSYIVDSCLFSQNTAAGGSGLRTLLNGSEIFFQLSNSLFQENTITESYGTGYIWTGGTGQANVQNCTFENNTGTISTGLDIGSFANNGGFLYNISNCSFLNNQATLYSGGLTLWGDTNSSPTFVVEDCQIIGNSAVERAGGIWILTSSDKFNATLDRCEIRNNNSPWGSAIGSFQEELSAYAVPVGSVFSVENSLIAGNTGDGGIITLDSFPGFEMMNTTVADNASSTFVLGDSSGVTLQNTILANPGHTEYNANTNSTATSNGGNLVLDSSLNANLTAQDKPETEPDFMPGTYEPSSTSPLVNAGVNAGVTATTDLAGEERIQQGIVDIGAYESPFGVSAAREVVVGEVELSPNPATDFLNIHLPESILEPVEVNLYDGQGRLMGQQFIAKGQMINVKDLPPGMYTLKLQEGGKSHAGRFVKQ
ncbi:MAG: T9SS type A sorting domain-containing protein [Saprospiraceae bacterium]